MVNGYSPKSAHVGGPAPPPPWEILDSPLRVCIAFVLTLYCYKCHIKTTYIRISLFIPQRSDYIRVQSLYIVSAVMLHNLYCLDG